MHRFHAPLGCFFSLTGNDSSTTSIGHAKNKRVHGGRGMFCCSSLTERQQQTPSCDAPNGDVSTTYSQQSLPPTPSAQLGRADACRIETLPRSACLRCRPDPARKRHAREQNMTHAPANSHQYCNIKLQKRVGHGLVTPMCMYCHGCSDWVRGNMSWKPPTTAARAHWF